MIKGKFNVVTDGQWGSAGKGLITSYLAWKHRPRYLSTTNMANAGHCQTADTYIITDRGLERLGNVVIQRTAQTTVNKDGVSESISHHHYDGVRSVNEVALANGTKFRCTDSHQYYVWDIDQTVRRWVRSMDLDPRFHMFLAPKKVAFPDNRLLPESFPLTVLPNRTIISLPPDCPERADERFAEYLGLLVGAGHYAGVQKIQIAFHEDQLDAAQEIIQLYYDMGITGTELKRVPNKKCFTLTIRQVSGMNELFDAIGLARAVKQHKTTPAGVMSSNKRTITAYLRGLFDANGSAKKDRIQLTNCARTVVEDAQQLLYVLGIHSCLTMRQCRRRTKAGRRLPQYVLSISGQRNMLHFQSTVGFISRIKTDRLQTLVNGTADQGPWLPLSDSVRQKLRTHRLAGRGSTGTSAVLAKPQLAVAVDPELCEVSTSCDTYHMIPIKRVSLAVDRLEVFDVTVPGTHSYLANGCVSHNTAVNTDGTPHVAKALPSCAILNRWCPEYNPEIVVGPSAAFNLTQLLKEYDQCILSEYQLWVHPRAGVITQGHADREAGITGDGSTKHIGSTMQGCGTFLADKVLRKPDLKLARDYPELTPYLRLQAGRKGPDPDCDPMPLKLLALMEMGQTVLHEGSQGFSLDISHGSHYPACTSRQTTATQNLADMGLPFTSMGDIYLVIRPFPIRVGNIIEDGKMVGYSGDAYDGQSEITWNDVAHHAGMPPDVRDSLLSKELTTVTKRLRRVFDYSHQQVREAAKVNGATRIALNFANYIDWNCRNTSDRTLLTSKIRQFIDEVEDSAQIPVTLVGTGPQLDHVIDLESRK